MNETTQSPSALQQLKTGVLRFQRETHAPASATYAFAATHPQQPHTLFITCSDSRIQVDALLGTKPGQVFVARNVGNIVPAYSRPLSDIAAVIEYAVSALKVKHVVVCGHADCGAMKAVLHPQATEKLPTVRAWLHNAEESQSGGTGESLRTLTERNVLKQLENLKTHPAVVDALHEGRLSLSGWVYEIGTGEVRIAEDGSREFAVVRADAGSAQGTVDA